TFHNHNYRQTRHLGKRKSDRIHDAANVAIEYLAVQDYSKAVAAIIEIKACANELATGHS
ncbi:unnamed protein product, partial [marine sediment metagenome]